LRIVRGRGGVPLWGERDHLAGLGGAAASLLLLLLLEKGEPVADVLGHGGAGVRHLRRPVGRVDGDAGSTRELRDTGFYGFHLPCGVLNLRQQFANELRIHPVELGHRARLHRDIGALHGSRGDRLREAR
jgi:hypothetical protein